MRDLENQKTEEEIAEQVAVALRVDGFEAADQDTGGGIVCVVVERAAGGEIIWGTADSNWGAVVYSADGSPTSSIETRCPSDTQDIAAIVEAIRGPSIDAGAAVRPPAA